MTALRAGRAFAAIFVAALAIAALACLLPQNAYQRWQLLHDTIHARSRWIWERSHYDPTPIDVALVGPSRTSEGISAPRLEADLRAAGIAAHVVNFSLPETGRNINYEVIRQMYQAGKRPRLIVLGVTEKPARFGHHAFKYLASASDIVDPGYFPDFNYFGDLLYLPYRQMELFVADLAPSWLGLRKRFDPADYAGTEVETTGDVRLPDGTIKNGHDPASGRELARGVRKLERGNHPPFLPRRYADLEFGDERHYIRAIVALARAHGAQIAFLSLPYYSGPSGLQEDGFYRRFGPVWNAGWLSPHAEWYADYGHLTRTGAEHATDWLAPRVAAALNGPGKRQ